MLDEKKRVDLENWKVIGYLNQGGQIESDDDGLEGIDAPANDIGWLSGG